jgi:hypothetical protein
MRDKNFQIIKRDIVQFRRELAGFIRYPKEFNFLTEEHAGVVINEKFQDNCSEYEREHLRVVLR